MNISTIVAAGGMIALPFLQEVKSIVQELGRDKSKVHHYLEMSRISESVPFYPLGPTFGKWEEQNNSVYKTGKGSMFSANFGNFSQISELQLFVIVFYVQILLIV